MRRFCSVVFVLVLLLLHCQNSTRVAAHSGIYQVNAGLGLNLRTGPSGDFPRLYTMPNGRLVTAMGHRGNWLKLRDRVTGTVGWAWLAYFVPYSGQTSGGGGSAGGTAGLRLCYDTTFHWTACAPEWIAETIYAAAHAYGIGPFWLMSIAACESGFDPNAWAYSPPDNVYGLYQFRPSTMAWIYPGGSVWSVHDSAYAAAKLLTIAPAQFDCAWRVGFI